jgi:RND superfamily putative drug exporter
VAIDDSLPVIVRWREERERGADGDAAIAAAMATAGRAVWFSGTTVAIGLLALVVVPVPAIRSMGFGGLLIPLVSLAWSAWVVRRRLAAAGAGLALLAVLVAFATTLNPAARRSTRWPAAGRPRPR